MIVTIRSSFDVKTCFSVGGIGASFIDFCGDRDGVVDVGVDRIRISIEVFETADDDNGFVETSEGSGDDSRSGIEVDDGVVDDGVDRIRISSEALETIVDENEFDETSLDSGDIARFVTGVGAAST